MSDDDKVYIFGILNEFHLYKPYLLTKDVEEYFYLNKILNVHTSFGVKNLQLNLMPNMDVESSTRKRELIYLYLDEVRFSISF